jgi:sugar transferase EpsL
MAAPGTRTELTETLILDSIRDVKDTIPWRRSTSQRLLKRGFDIAGSILLLPLCLPIMLVVAVLIWLTSRGPVLLVQSRLGLDGVSFGMYKFRTMIAEREDGFANGSGEVTDIDPRLTPIGRWLRAWRLDELPQLWHVLMGEMSLVGPRPDLLSNLGYYAPEQMLRFAMPPGCTAWTLTRGAFENDWNARQNINVEYVKQWSFWLDLEILLDSIFVVLAQNNTSPKTNAQPRPLLQMQMGADIEE